MLDDQTVPDPVPSGCRPDSLRSMTVHGAWTNRQVLE
jgi:hypothetical protein